MVYIFPFVAIGVGYLISLFVLNKKMGIEQYLLPFSGAFLLSITLFELLPEVFSEQQNNVGLLIMIGILLQIILDFITKGAEHGHVHIHTNNLRFPWLLFLGLSIHSIIEGFPITENNDMLLGVVVHKIPIAVILSTYFITAGYSKKATFLFLILFSLMTPAGSFLSEEATFLKPFSAEINAIAIGVFLHVSTTILFESSKDHKFNLLKLSTILLGVLLAYLL
ncbi:MAG: ZIP family metal transporter [Flavobacteriaceae bacterium]|nr:ZIP family metal transporter [Flavobacteriaceae bacterium]